MAKLVGLSIDVDKINKDKLYKGKKGTYLKLTIALNDQEDNYGNTVSCWEEQSEEERKNKDKKNYLGNGKVVWSDDSQPAKAESSDDDLPF
jgi:hypothetical protein